MVKHRRLSYLLGWDPSKGHRLGITTVMEVPARECVVTCGRDGTVREWKGRTCTSVSIDHSECVNDIAVIPSTICYVTASADNAIFIHHRKGSGAVENACHSDSVKKVAVCENFVLSASLDQTVLQHDLQKELAVVQTYASKAPLYSLCVGADCTSVEKTFFTGCGEGSIALLDVRSSKSSVANVGSNDQLTRHAHRGVIRDLCPFGPHQLLSASSDCSVKLWDLRAMRYTLHTVQHSDSVFTLCPIMHTATYLSGGRDGAVVAVNTATLKTSNILHCSYPILDISLAQHQQLLYVGTTSSDVEGFSMPSMLSEETIRGGLRDDSMIISPSRISVEIDGTPQRAQQQGEQKGAEAVLPPVSDFTAYEPRKYNSPQIRTISFESKQDGLNWCTSRTRSEYKDARGSSELVLHGAVAVVEIIMLSDKRHALAKYDDQSVILWNLVSLGKVKVWAMATHSKLADMVKQMEMPTYCQTWCTLECRWGCVCITMSADEAFNASVNAWELMRHPGDAATPLSIHSLSRHKRLELRKNSQINIGLKVLQKLFELFTNLSGSQESDISTAGSSSIPGVPSGEEVHSSATTEFRRVSNPEGQENQKEQNSTRYICVWAPSLGQSSNDYRTVHRYDLSHISDLNDSRVPLWVSQCLGGNILKSPALSSSIQMEFLPLGKSLAAIPKPIIKVPKHFCLADAAQEILSQLKLIKKLPTTKEAQEMLQKKKKEDGSDGFVVEGNNDADVPVTPDEFVQFLSHNQETVIDPLMAAGAVYILYKERGKGSLQVYYRKYPGLCE